MNLEIVKMIGYAVQCVHIRVSSFPCDLSRDLCGFYFKIVIAISC